MRVQLNLGLTKHPDHALEVAFLIAHWNATEDVATQLLVTFFGLEMGQAAELMKPIQSSKTKMDMLLTAGLQFIKSDENLRKELNDLVSDFSNRLKSRNKYAHGVYGVNDAGELVIYNRAIGRFEENSYTQVSLDDLRQEVSRMQQTFNRAIRFHERLYEWIPPQLHQALQQVQVLRAALR